MDGANLVPIWRQSGASGRPILRRMREVSKIQFWAYYLFTGNKETYFRCLKLLLEPPSGKNQKFEKFL